MKTNGFAICRSQRKEYYGSTWKLSYIDLDGNECGFLVYVDPSHSGDGEIHIEELETHKQYRSQGVASALLSCLIELSVAEYGRASIYAVVDAVKGMDPKRLVALYARHGFEVVERPSADETRMRFRHRHNTPS